MKHSLAIAVVTATFCAPCAGADRAAASDLGHRRGHRVVAPDQAQIDGGVTSDARPRGGVRGQQCGDHKVLRALKGAGIEEKDTQTSRLSLQPQYAPNRTGTSPITGYRASNRVTIRLRDVTKVANVIDVLVGAGANDIGGINFTVSHRPSTWTRPARRRSRMPGARRRSMRRPPA